MEAKKPFEHLAKTADVKRWGASRLQVTPRTCATSTGAFLQGLGQGPLNFTKKLAPQICGAQWGAATIYPGILIILLTNTPTPNCSSLSHLSAKPLGYQGGNSVAPSTSPSALHSNWFRHCSNMRVAVRARQRQMRAPGHSSRQLLPSPGPVALTPDRATCVKQARVGQGCCIFGLQSWKAISPDKAN